MDVLRIACKISAYIEHANLIEPSLHQHEHKKAPTTQSKLSRIIQFAPDIKKFFFIDDAHCSKEYRAFMQEVTLFVQTGKNKHDDACDSLAMLVEFLDTRGRVVTVMKRPF